MYFRVLGSCTSGHEARETGKSIADRARDMRLRRASACQGGGGKISCVSVCSCVFSEEISVFAPVFPVQFRCSGVCFDTLEGGLGMRI